jgi:hypothetical protein
MNSNTIALLPRRTVCFLSFAGVLGLGWLDWVSGFQMNFFAFYFLPVAWLAWAVGAAPAYAAAILSGLVWFVVDQHSGFPYTNEFFGFWNAGMRLISFLIIAFAVSRIRSLLDKSRMIAHRLTGLLPICAWCKKVRNDEGYWEQVEQYFQEHAEARFTHGVCEECKQRIQHGLSEEKQRDKALLETSLPHVRRHRRKKTRERNQDS